LKLPPKLDIPEPVLAIARKLEGAGHEAWCVGGAVRDNLLGLHNKDFDLATAATPEQMRSLFRQTIPIGIEHGTVAVLDGQKTLHEVTTFRQDVKTDGRHAVVEFGVSLEEDLARRDFTINAIAYHPLRHEWRDPFNGGDDLSRKVIRAVGDPIKRFEEDYLRILRALRFAARFRFEIDGDTMQAAKDNVEGLKYLSAERVRDEWFKGLESAEKASELAELWMDVGAMAIWLPEIESGEQGAGPDGEEGGGRREEGGETAFARIDDFPTRDPVLITAYLSTDPAATLSRLKCSRAQIERGRVVGEWRNRSPDPNSVVDVRRWMAALGPGVDDLVTIFEVGRGTGVLREAVQAVRESGAPLVVSELAISGRDLIELGIPEGRKVGEILKQLFDEALDDPSMNVRDQLLNRAQELASSPLPPPRGGGSREE
jgi:tRNA nucleotidyltransferase (CCA-adding enzyme)